MSILIAPRDTKRGEQCLTAEEQRITTKRPRWIWQWLRSPRGQSLRAFLAIAAVFLIMGHRTHLFGVLPYVLFLLCPVLHLFMHGRHGRGHAGHGTSHRRPSQGDA